MSPGRVDARVVAAKLELVEKMLGAIATLPLSSVEAFVAEPHMASARLTGSP